MFLFPAVYVYIYMYSHMNLSILFVLPLINCKCTYDRFFSNVYDYLEQRLSWTSHQRVAESYGQIWKLRPMNVEALKTAAKIWNY
ncbi:hypothetical protein L6452_36767 [Arctium lappa]|uniref:Uncharacterized protein n=1 Tax=Arctium lappa TaxID=4217 RepID=A0ACB8Y2L6_ARCLA|nr:hypothetical protein L6452_36767 [Arctium lappa]